MINLPLTEDFEQRLKVAEEKDWRYNKLCIAIFFILFLISSIYIHPVSYNGWAGAALLAFCLQIIFLVYYDKRIIGTEFHPEFAYDGVVVKFMKSQGYSHWRWQNFSKDNKDWYVAYPKRNPLTGRYYVSIRPYDSGRDDPQS